MLGNQDRKLVRRKAVGDLSLLAPLAYVQEEIPSKRCDRGVLIVPRRDAAEDEVEIWVPSFGEDDAVPLFGKGER